MKVSEVGIIESIQDKLAKRFSNILEFAKDEFSELHKDLLDNPRLGQLFYGWFFGSFCLYDGKTIPNLCLEILELNESEKILLNNIKQAIPGFFEVLEVKEKIVDLKDMLTKKEYTIKTIDLEPMPKKGECLEASLVKNLAGDYFFFGGFIKREEIEGINWNLLEYSRDLTANEAVEREYGIISRMERKWQKDILVNYLQEVFGISNIEIKKFLKLNEKKRKWVLKDIIEEIENDERKD